MLADKVWLPVCVPVHPIGVGRGWCQCPLQASPGKTISFLDLALCIGTVSCSNRKGPKHSLCCKVGNTLLGGILVSQRMSDTCCSRGRMEWLGTGGALLNFVECTLYTEADLEHGWEGSSTSLIPQGWQISYFFSQVIISGWVIYGFCNGSVTWPQGSQMSLRALAAVSTLRYFFPHLSLMPGRCIHLQTTELSHKSAAAGCIDLPYGSFWSMSLCCNFECLFGAVLILSWNWPPSCPHLCIKMCFVV